MDSRLQLKHGLLQGLLTEAKERMGGKLKAKYAPPPPPAPEAPAGDERPPAEGEHEALSPEELERLLSMES